MPKAQFDRNPDYGTYINLLRKLHVLMSSGHGDSPEADDLRDAMDSPWRGLSELELTRVRGLSADLYSLDVKEEPLVEEPSDGEKSIVLQAYEARNKGDWDLTLALLRKVSRFLPLSLVSYLRGGIWLELKDAETANLFYEKAALLAPGNINYQCIYLDSLVRSGHNARANRIAEEVLSSHSNTNPNFVMRAADILFNSTRGMDLKEASDQYRRLIPILTDAVARAELLPNENRVESIEIAGLVELGMCFEHLGRFEDAVLQYNRALTINPNHDAALVARGIIRYGTQSQAALKDFEAAISVGTPLVWPFFFLCHHALISGNYYECVSLALAGLQCKLTTPVQANLLEWLAISGSMTGMADEEVTQYFQQAIKLAPRDKRMEQNFMEFQRWTQSKRRAETVAVNWIYTPIENVREMGLARLAA